MMRRKYLRMVPIVIAVGIIPLIVRVSIHSNEELAGYSWLPQDYYTYVDVFLACKAAAIQVLMGLMAATLIYFAVFRKEKLPVNRLFILPGLYLFFIILSAVLSDHISLAFKGSFERFEPAGVLAAYLVLFYYSYVSVKDEDDLRLLIRLSSLFFGLMILLGILQGLRADPFSLEFFKKLITPSSMHGSLDSLQLIRDKGVAYLTLYNEDYLGMYFALIIPVFISLVFALQSRMGRITAAVFSLAAFFVLYHGRSLSGWAGLILAGIAAVMILSGAGGRRAVFSWSCLAAAGIIITLFLVFHPTVRDRFMGLTGQVPERVRKVTGLKTTDNEVEFDLFDGNELHCTIDYPDGEGISPHFYDREGNELIYYYNDGVFTLEERFMYADAALYECKIGAVRAVMFEIDEHRWPFIKGEDGGIYYLNQAGKAVKVMPVRKLNLFEDTFLSGRGAIWNRSIPLLKEHILTGSGANTYITEYPQDDYVYLNYTYGWNWAEYNVKAHSMYLGNMTENGILGTLCLISFFIIYIVKGVKRYSRRPGGDEKGRFSYYTGLGLYLGCFAYMMTGLVNDSNVCTGPVYWVFLGISCRDLFSMPKK